jgi:hypothetical protein
MVDIDGVISETRKSLSLKCYEVEVTSPGYSRDVHISFVLVKHVCQLLMFCMHPKEKKTV